MRRWMMAAALCACAALMLPAAAGAAAFTPGTPGTGDPCFPLAGNGGYEVDHYLLKLTYRPEDNHLSGRATLRATATQDLSRFDLDLRSLAVKAVLVDGAAADFARDGQELTVAPAGGIRAGSAFEVVVRYAGVPEIVTDPNGDIEGWIPTTDGACALGECVGSPAWYPANDDPEDKATYDFAVTVPEGLTAIANGVLLSHRTSGGETTWRWREADPMAPYLASTAIGQFDLTRYEIDGIPAYVAVDPQCPKGTILRKLPAIVHFLTQMYGPYPFTAVGAIVDNAKLVGYELETQTKPYYNHMPNEWTLVHETAHMWYGDSVTLKDWPDIWLNEGFATFSNWLWMEAQGKKTASSQFHAYYSTGGWIWGLETGNVLDPADLFDWGGVYVRGAMTLQALREKVADDDVFFGIMRDWAAQHRHGAATSAQFIALAEEKSGLDLDAFFRAWLYQPDKPTAW